MATQRDGPAWLHYGRKAGFWQSSYLDHQGGLPTAIFLPSTTPRIPLPVTEWNSSGWESLSPRFAAASTIAAPRGCSLARSRLAARRSSSGSSASASREADELRLAFGQGSGFVDDQGVDFFENLQRFGILDENAGAGPAADADHDRHGRGET